MFNIVMDGIRAISGSSGDEIIRGKRQGRHKAADFALEAAYLNDRSNPQFELGPHTQ